MEFTAIPELAKKLADNIFSGESKHSPEDIKETASRAGAEAKAQASQASAKLESAVESAIESARPLASQALSALAATALQAHGALERAAASFSEVDIAAKRKARATQKEPASDEPSPPPPPAP